MKDPIFKSSVETILITQELQKIEVGGIMTYERIQEISGKPVDEVRQSVSTALRRAMRDYNMVFACIRKVGFKRLNDMEIVDKGSSDIAALRRRGLRVLEQQMKADFEKLSHSKQMQSSAQVSVLATVAMMTATKEISELSEKIDRGVRQLPTHQTLRMFTKGGG